MKKAIISLIPLCLLLACTPESDIIPDKIEVLSRSSHILKQKNVFLTPEEALELSNNAMCNFFAESKKSRNVNSLNGTVTLFNPDVMSRTVQTDTSFYVINYESPNEFTKNVLTICNIRPKYKTTAN